MKIYLIAGKARSGKDTTSKIMQKVLEENGIKTCFCPISKYIKHYAKDYFGWDGLDETKPRDLLNYLGTEVIRKKLNHPEFFVDRTLQDVEVLEEFFDALIVPDIRFLIEIEKIKEKYPDTCVIRVERPNFESPLTGEQQKYIIETALDDYKDYDYYIVNDDTKEKLEEKVRKILVGNGDINE